MHAGRADDLNLFLVHAHNFLGASNSPRRCHLYEGTLQQRSSKPSQGDEEHDPRCEHDSENCSAHDYLHHYVHLMLLISNPGSRE